MRFFAPIDFFSRAELPKHDRDPSTLERSATVRVCPTGARPDDWDMEPIAGSVSRIADQIHGFAAMGVSHVTVCLWPNNKESVEAFAPVLDELKR